MSAKAISPTDPAARYTAAANSAAVNGYSANYLVDLEHAAIVDVEAATAICQAEVGAAKTMLDEKERRRKLLFDQRARPAPAEGGLIAA